MNEISREELLEEIRKDENAFLKATPELQGDEGFVLRAFALNGKILPFISQDFYNKIINTYKGAMLEQLEHSEMYINGWEDEIKKIEESDRYDPEDKENEIYQWSFAIEREQEYMKRTKENIQKAENGEFSNLKSFKNIVIHEIIYDAESELDRLNNEVLYDYGIDENGEEYEIKAWYEGPIEEWEDKVTKLDKIIKELKDCEIIEDLEQEEHTPEEIADGIEPRMGEVLDIQNEMTKEMEEYMNNIDNKQVEK